MTEPAARPRFRPYEGERGIGGFLLLFLITQAISFLLLLAQLPRLLAGFHGPEWALGATASLLRPTIVFEAIAIAFRVAGIPVGLWLAFRRSRLAPEFYQVFLGTIIVLCAIDALLIWRMTAELHAQLAAEGASSDTILAARYQGLLSVFRLAGYALIWLLYWRGSERVRLTYTPAEPAVTPAAR